MLNKLKRINEIVFEDVDKDKLIEGFYSIKDKIPTSRKDIESLQNGILHYGVEIEQRVKKLFEDKK